MALWRKDLRWGFLERQMFPRVYAMMLSLSICTVGKWERFACMMDLLRRASGKVA